MSPSQYLGKTKLASKSFVTDISGQWIDLKITYVGEKAGGVRVSAEIMNAQGQPLAIATASGISDPLPPKGRIGLRAWVNPKAGSGEIQI
jgi:hypothetical protein